MSRTIHADQKPRSEYADSRLVSVIMPVLDVAPYIEAAVTSILCQSYPNLELIVIDGGSTDGTLKRLARIQDPRLRLIAGNKRREFVPALNEGIQEARGEWIVRMDGDDICHPYRLERQLAFLDAHPEAVFVGTGEGYLTPGGYLMRRRDANQRGDQEVTTYSITAGTVQFSDGSVMCRRELAVGVGGYDEAFPKKDTSLWYRLLSRGSGFVINYCDYWIRIREGSLTYNHMVADTVWRAIREHYDPIGLKRAYPNPVPPTPSQQRINFHFHNLLVCAAAGDWDAAVKRAWWICRLRPFDLMSYRRVLLAALGRDTLHFWRRPRKRIPSKYVPFVPEDPTVARVLANLGVRTARQGDSRAAH